MNTSAAEYISTANAITPFKYPRMNGSKITRIRTGSPTKTRFSYLMKNSTNTSTNKMFNILWICWQLSQNTSNLQTKSLRHTKKRMSKRNRAIQLLKKKVNPNPREREREQEHVFLIFFFWGSCEMLIGIGIPPSSL